LYALLMAACTEAIMERMTIHVQRAVAITLMMIALPNTGCYAAHYQRLEPGSSLDYASGITTRSGKEIRFAVDGATIRNDTLIARGREGEVKVPTDSVAQVRGRKFAPWRTGALIVGAIAATLTALFVTTCCSFSGS
jgi:hypothetical protein